MAPQCDAERHELISVRENTYRADAPRRHAVLDAPRPVPNLRRSANL
ncbi:hypothetical protein KPSA1_06383 [Pseudomonas syringae pv. actinidiae]|uniref:Uncharacterized protein n=1 Tax=Pseudomonas syringae pv. actinidiae TaxID=103796 RepID=A0A2V0QJB3_PSESF|nr:hypothetical protein KPSA1_06383 [Pseudomonas syringae pv. actinidiae]